MKKFAYILSFSLLFSTFNLQATEIPKSERCGINNPYHLLINQEHPLAPDYKPSNLVIPKVTFETPGNIEKNYMESTAAAALEQLFEAAKAENIRLVAISGYRSYSRQNTLYNTAVRRYGSSQQGTAKAGASEHQSGLAMDLNSLYQSFGNTKEGKWLAQNAHHYGFIIRYPKNKTAITGYIYEPWHIRYVGTELATYCYENDLTLEEIDVCCEKDIEVDMHISNTEKLTLKPYRVIKRQDVTYIKARDLIDNLGGSIAFQSGTLTLNTSGQELILKENSNYIMLNQIPTTIATSPIRINNSIYIPLQTTLDLLDFNIDFINSSTLLIIKKSLSTEDSLPVEIPSPTEDSLPIEEVLPKNNQSLKLNIAH